MRGSHARSGAQGRVNRVPREKLAARAAPENCPNLRENGRKTLRPPGSQRAGSNLSWQVQDRCFTLSLILYLRPTTNLEIFVFENQWDLNFQIILPTQSKSVGFRFSPRISSSKLKHKVKGTLVGFPENLSWHTTKISFSFQHYPQCI